MADSNENSAAEAEPENRADNSNNPPTAASKFTTQLKKLQEANNKYKSLLKLAKERITQQETELEDLKQEKTSLEEQLASSDRPTTGRDAGADDGPDRGAPVEEVRNIVRVCQRVKTVTGSQDGVEEIWALFEVEISPMNDMDTAPVKRIFEWKRFDTESELQDGIRRDTGEPLKLPPYSLSPDQSARIEKEAASKVTQVTEEFRRFRVRSELARKQADAQIRDLQNNQMQVAARRIEGQEAAMELEQARSATGQLERMKAELAAQEAHWKEAYDMLLAENNTLKSKGSEALLASQWRQRYETCLKEKEDAESKLTSALSKADQTEAAKFEAKYKDLKESFRLYRKKAKEIFEAQERGVLVAPGGANSHVTPYSDESSAEAKLSYLKNLMVNYLSTDQSVRDHMEGAIATVLKFSPEEVERIEKKKAENEAWF